MGRDKQVIIMLLPSERGIALVVSRAGVSVLVSLSIEESGEPIQNCEEGSMIEGGHELPFGTHVSLKGCIVHSKGMNPCNQEENIAQILEMRVLERMQEDKGLCEPQYLRRLSRP